MHIYQLIYIAALCCAILEIFTTTFILLGFALALLLVAMTEQLLSTTNYNRDVLIFGLTSAIFTYTFRKLFAGRRDTEFNDDDINQY